MKHDRTGSLVNEGIEIIKKANDPLKQKIFMIRVSMSKKLKNKAHTTGLSESEIVRNALEGVL